MSQLDTNDKCDVIDQLYGKLTEYLTIHHHIKQGSNGLFKCFTKLHEDKTPSLGILPTNSHVWHCLSCNQSGNIFHAAHFIEDLPIEGPDFWKITVPSLAKRFNIPYTQEEMEQADKDRYQMLRAYKDAADIICSHPDKEKEKDDQNKIYEYLNERKLSIQTAIELGIGSVSSHAEYMKKLKNMGWSKEYLYSIELENKTIFNQRNLIFTVKDINGRPIGFAARDMKWTHGSVDRKYNNNRTSIIYKKGSTLWNFHNISNSGPLWLVEGYMDAATMWQAGIKNVVALGGTAFSADHVALLKQHDIYNLNLMLDNDDSGQLNTENILKNHFGTSILFDVKICNYNKDMSDPDSIINTYGVEEFKKLQLMDSFDWDLKRLPYDIDKHIVASGKIAEIASEKSGIKRDKMIQTLSEFTEIEKHIIEDDVKRKMGDKDYKLDEAKRKLKEHVLSNIDRDLFRKKVEPSLWINELSSYWIGITQTIVPVVNDLEKYKDRLDDAKRKCVDDPDIPFKMNRFKIFTQKADGIPKRACFITFGGLPNIGKSSILRAIAWDLIQSNDDAMVLFISIDDAFLKVISSFLALGSGLTINEIKRAKVVIGNNKEKKSKWVNVWKKFLDEKIFERLVIKDATDGNTISSIEKYIQYYQKLFPNKKMIVILDSLHKLKDYSGMDQRIKFSNISLRLKELTNTYNIPMIAIVELKRIMFGTKPTLNDIRETSSIEYDSDMVWLLHQEYHVDRNTHLIKQIQTDSGSLVCPVNELVFGKNKDGEFKGSLYFYFKTNTSQFEEVPDSDIALMMEAEENRKKRKSTSVFDDPVSTQPQQLGFKGKTQQW